MGTLVILAILALVVLGFNSPVWWLVAAGLLYLHLRYGRTGQGSPGSSKGGPSGSSGSGARMDTSYSAYRRRRDQQARWERRYRRERPWMAKRKGS